jgi:hypothetical protein
VHDKLMDIYSKMYEYFGPRHWWPADSSFEMITGAILTQNVILSIVQRFRMSPCFRLTSLKPPKTLYHLLADGEKMCHYHPSCHELMQ